MRRTTYRQEEWATLPPSFGAVGTRPLDEKPLPPTLIMLPGDVKAAEPLDSWSFSDTIALDAGDGLRVKILAIDTSERIGKVTMAIGRGPDYEGRAVITAPIRRRTLAPLRLSRGMRRHIRRMKAARPYAIGTE